MGPFSPSSTVLRSPILELMLCEKRPRGVESQAHTPSLTKPRTIFLETRSNAASTSKEFDRSEASHFRKPGDNKPDHHTGKGGVHASRERCNFCPKFQRKFSADSNSPFPLSNQITPKGCHGEKRAASKPVTVLTEAILSPCKRKNSIGLGVGVCSAQDRSISRLDRPTFVEMVG